MSIAESSLVLAAQAHPPSTGKGTVTAGSASTAQQDLSALEGQWVMFVLTEPAHISFGVTGLAAADTSDLYWPKDTLIERFIPRDGSRSFFRAIRQGGTDAVIYWAEVGS